MPVQNVLIAQFISPDPCRVQTFQPFHLCFRLIRWLDDGHVFHPRAVPCGPSSSKSVLARPRQQKQPRMLFLCFDTFGVTHASKTVLTRIVHTCKHASMHTHMHAYIHSIQRSQRVSLSTLVCNNLWAPNSADIKFSFSRPPKVEYSAQDLSERMIVIATTSLKNNAQLAKPLSQISHPPHFVPGRRHWRSSFEAFAATAGPSAGGLLFVYLVETTVHDFNQLYLDDGRCSSCKPSTLLETQCLVTLHSFIIIPAFQIL